MSDILHSYQIKKIDDGLIFYTRYFGELTLDLLMESSVRRTDDALYENAVFIVVDVQDAQLSKLIPDDIQIMSHRVRGVLDRKPHLVVIIVARDPYAYGLSRMWYGATKVKSSELYIARSESEAMKIVQRIREQRKI